MNLKLILSHLQFFPEIWNQFVGKSLKFGGLKIEILKSLVFQVLIFKGHLGEVNSVHSKMPRYKKPCFQMGMRVTVTYELRGFVKSYLM